MKKSIAEQLRLHLASITNEEFAVEWSDIKSMELGGPSIDAFEYSWNSAHCEPLHSLLSAPAELATTNIRTPNKLTPDYWGLYFFSKLAI